MDIIFIEGLTVPTTIGYFDWEKQIKQPLIFDLQMGTDIRAAAAGDELAKTLDYAQISVAIAEFANAKVVDLLETLAENLASHLMERFDIKWLSLKISKPEAVKEANAVGVIIERGVRT
ncbi:dihydroneopterin aldolase [Thalassomonas sp. M1454]|uniref:dihydroneopterin aldolase n=1 Tax=Thalassomonas sp. M1454 TaxID=2594477 RepID=UPI00117C0034|nr:dihydroneopterin aldolase [Thalassomonas sp. M1454]TRX53909.1 dihydroneopterin aldolase [Thalassomonas sp. M1454]